ncbi:MAG: hypothetical protein AABX32_05815 [Nanoarchaeota archaeon]
MKIIILISIIILLNIGFSYKLFTSTLYGDSFESIESEFSKILQPKFENSVNEYQFIGNLLKNQSNIENSYIMAELVNYAYYSGGKFLYTDFREGIPSDSIHDFIKRKNWSEYDRYISNIHSYPRDKNDLFNPIPDYVIYRKIPYDNNTTWFQKPTFYADVSILEHPDSLPPYFELLYHSNNTNTFVYKIHHGN